MTVRGLLLAAALLASRANGGGGLPPLLGLEIPLAATLRGSVITPQGGRGAASSGAGGGPHTACAGCRITLSPQG